ncbi:MAG TPA: hypothetical protein PKA88_30865, partial [Polyangiaceae bacterium]|nr:hypothetical protein [Polyangiaceae bacterium]
SAPPARASSVPCSSTSSPRAGAKAAGSAGAGEPCDFQNPEVVTLGTAVTRELPSANCASKLHFYRFTPTTAGVYTITKSGAGNLGFCETAAGGCICGVNINCCASCSLTFDLPSGAPLPAGSNNEIYIDPVGASGTYTFTVTGPN